MVSKIFLVLAVGLLLQSAVRAQTKLSNLVETVKNAGNFKTLYQGILSSGYLLTLAGGRGPYTIFAPTDDAFAKLSPETLQYLFKPENRQVLANVIGYHVASGNLTVAAIQELNLPVNVSVFWSQPIVVSEDKGKIKVNDATVIKADVFATNGVVHGIDTVLMAPPGNIADMILKNPNFQILAKALQAADLVQTLQSRGPFTFFAPTDYAFQKLPPGTLDNLLKPENKIALFKILTYHAVEGAYTAATLNALNPPTTLTAVNLKPLSVNEYGKSIFINDATVVIADILGTNGVLHGINQVLLPS